jgi:hypothetical protein
MHRPSITILAVAMAGLGIAACQTTGQKAEMPASAELAPIERPNHAVGTRFVFKRRDGKDVTLTITARADDGSYTVENSEGCAYTRPDNNRFAPELSWRGCDGTEGTQQIQASEGSIWPLKVGATQRWTYDGKNSSGQSWQGARTCEVPAAVRVTIAAGAFDAFKVVCRDEGEGFHATRTWYVAPALRGASALYLSETSWRGSSRSEYMSGPHLPKSS